MPAIDVFGRVVRYPRGRDGGRRPVVLAAAGEVLALLGSTARATTTVETLEGYKWLTGLGEAPAVPRRATTR